MFDTSNQIDNKDVMRIWLEDFDKHKVHIEKEEVFSWLLTIILSGMGGLICSNHGDLIVFEISDLISLQDNKSDLVTRKDVYPVDILVMQSRFI